MPEQAGVKPTIVLVHGTFADASTRRTLARGRERELTMTNGTPAVAGRMVGPRWYHRDERLTVNY